MSCGVAYPTTARSAGMVKGARLALRHPKSHAGCKGGLHKIGEGELRLGLGLVGKRQEKGYLP